MPARARCPTVLLLIDQSASRWSSQEDFCLAMVKMARSSGAGCVVAYSSPPAPLVHDRLQAAGAVLEVLDQVELGLLRFCRAARRLCDRHGVELVHLLHYPASTPLTLWLPLFVPAAVVLTEYPSGYGRRRARLKQMVFEAFNRVMNAGIIRLVAPSAFVVNRLVQTRGIAPGRVECILNGVDLDRFRPRDRAAVRRTLGLPDDVPVVLTAANLLPLKAVDILIRAFQRMVAKHPEALLLIAGEGSERGNLERLARELGVADRTRFLGQRDDIEHLLAASTVFCCPSVWGESFGWVNAEAMACGIPVVSTDTGAIPEVVVHGECGLLVPPRDAEAMATALLSLADSPSLGVAMGQAGRKRVDACFDLRRNVEAHRDLYERVTGARRGPAPRGQ